MRRLALLAVLVAAPALAAEPPRADPAQQALVQMIGEAQSREAAALVQVYALKARLAEMERKGEVETRPQEFKSSPPPPLPAEPTVPPAPERAE